MKTKRIPSSRVIIEPFVERHFNYLMKKEIKE